MATLKAKINLNTLNKECNLIDHAKIKWAYYYNTKPIIQCKRCQQLGHATSNCFAPTRCLKCAGDLWSRECPHDVTTAPKCANCGASQLSNSEECVVSRKIIGNIEERKQRSQHSRKPPLQRYQPAPMPTYNAANPPAPQQQPRFTKSNKKK